MNEKVNITKKCWHCGKEFDFYLTLEQVWELDKGEKHIQVILSNLSADDRELFISGICGKCFDDMFLENKDD